MLLTLLLAMRQTRYIGDDALSENVQFPTQVSCPHCGKMFGGRRDLTVHLTRSLSQSTQFETNEKYFDKLPEPEMETFQPRLIFNILICPQGLGLPDGPREPGGV